MSLWAFQERLDALGHFYTRYKTSDALQLHFSSQLDKLVANGFIAFAPEPAAAVASQATLSGSGAIAQGSGATATGTGGVLVRGTNTGTINTGTQVDTGGKVQVDGDFVGRDRITKK